MTRRVTMLLAPLALLVQFAPAQAQTYVGNYTGTVTSSIVNDYPVGDPPSYNFDGQTITGSFQIDFGTNLYGIYIGLLPSFGFAGFGGDSDDDPNDWASYSEAGGIGTLQVSPDLIGIDSWALFTISFNLSALNNPLVPLTGNGSYQFYYNQAGTGGGDLDGYINFSLTGGRLTGTVPEPSSWLMLIGGFGLAGAGLRARRLRVSIA